MTPKPQPPTWNFVGYVVAIAAGVAAAMIIAALVARYLLEQADSAWIREAGIYDPVDPVSPADLSALLEEARRIGQEQPRSE
jgi:hypothetical protein